MSKASHAFSYHRTRFRFPRLGVLLIHIVRTLSFSVVDYPSTNVTISDTCTVSSGCYTSPYDHDTKRAAAGIAMAFISLRV